MENIVELFESAVTRTPEKDFLLFGDSALSYSEALESAGRIANGYLSLGIRKGDRIAILLPNCLEFPLAWLAANMIGGVMVPVNGRFVAHEIEYILNHSEARLLVTSSRHQRVIEEIHDRIPLVKRIVEIDEAGIPGAVPYRSLLENPPTPPAVDIDGDDLAVFLYTSGTTGNPKGCMASHFYFVNLADIEARLFDLGPEDRVYTAQPFYYMDPQWNTLMVMKSNATLAIAEKFSTSHFWDDIRRYGVTCFYCIGSMTSFLYNMPAGPLDKEHKLRYVQTSGILPRIHEAWEKRFNVPVFEAYASTETACDIAVTPEHDRKVGTACIGRPVHYREARVVDDEDREVGAGQVGEIVLKKARGMMQGYFKDPAATEWAFRGGWFHSGDLGYVDPDGDFHFVGRKKDIIRRGGENISAASIEQALMEHPKIMDVAVIPVPDPIRGEEVKAYVVLKPGEPASYEEIAEFCEENMAVFKIPRYYEFRESLPKTPSERVQKRKLMEERPDLTVRCYDRSTKTTKA